VALSNTSTGTPTVLTFTNSANNETGFIVQRDTDGDASFKTITTLNESPAAGATVTYQDTTAQGNAQYNYQVAAVNTYGTSAYSPVYGSKPFQAAPSNLQVIAPSNGVVNLQWTNNSVWATLAWIYRTDPAHPTAVVLDPSGIFAGGALGVTETYQDTTVAPGTT